MPIRLDVSTGAEYIARGIEALGEGFWKIAEAKRATDFSTKKRQFEEASFGAFNTYSTTGDPKAQETIEQKWSQDAEKILSTDDPFLRQALNRYKNEVLPEWGQTFAKQKLAIQTRQVDDAAKINIQKAMEFGDLGSAAKEIMTLKNLGRISQADAAQQIKDLPNEVVLTQAGKMIYGGDPAGGLKKFTELDMKSLSEPRTKYAYQLKNAGEQLLTENNDAFERSILTDILKADKQNLPYLQKSSLALELKQKITTSTLSGSEARTWFDYIEKWEKGEDNETDFDTYSMLDKQVLNADIYGGIGQVEKNIGQARNKLSRPDLKGLFDKLQAATDKSDNVNLDQAYDYLYGQIVGDTSMITTVSGAAKMKYNQAKNELYNYYLEHKDKGFRGRKIFDYAVNELARKPEYQLDVIQMYKDQAQRRKEQVQKAKQKKSTKPTDDRSMLDIILRK